MHRRRGDLPIYEGVRDCWSIGILQSGLRQVHKGVGWCNAEYGWDVVGARPSVAGDLPRAKSWEHARVGEREVAGGGPV